MIPYSPPVKIDSNGNYLRFRGVTIVSNLKDKDGEIWEIFQKEISNNPIITESYSLLPSSSYHMTTLSLYTEKNDGGAHFESFIESKLSWFQNVSEKLFLSEINPKVTVQKAIAGRSALLIPVDLDLESKKINEAFGEALSLKDKIPEEYHLTLGYPFKSLSAEEKLRAENEVQKVVEKIFLPETQTFEFKKPTLCYFLDMTRFIPWDGKENPFTFC